MDIHGSIKLLTIFGSAIGAVYAPIFDFKKDGSVTRHGRLAIVGIGCTTIFAIYLFLGDEDDAKAERIRLQQQNDRQQQILHSSLEARAQIQDLLLRMDHMKADIDGASDHLARRLANSSLKMTQKLDAQLLQAQQLKQELVVRSQQASSSIGSLRGALSDFDGAVKWSLARLERPLRELSFSYSVIYDHADQRFPRYYARIAKIASAFGGSGKASEATGVVELLDRDMYAFSNLDGDEAVAELDFERASIAFRSASDAEDAPVHREYRSEAWVEMADKVKTRQIGPEGLHTLRRRWIKISVDFDSRIITKQVHFTAVKLLGNDGKLTSELDIAGPDAKALVVDVTRRRQRDFQLPRFSDFVIHFADTNDGSVFIPGTACAPSQQNADALTCRLESGSISSSDLCPTYVELSVPEGCESSPAAKRSQELWDQLKKASECQDWETVLDPVGKTPRVGGLELQRIKCRE